MLFSSSAYRKESEHEIHTTTCLTAVCCSQDLSPRVISYFSPTSNCIQSVSPSPVFSYATLMKSCLDYTSLDTLSISCSALEPENLFIPGFQNSQHLHHIPSITSLKGYKPKQQLQPRHTAWREFKNCWKAWWICFLFSPHFMKKTGVWY